MKVYVEFGFVPQGRVPVDAEGPVPQAMRVLRRPHHVQQQVMHHYEKQSPGEQPSTR